MQDFRSAPPHILLIDDDAQVLDDLSVALTKADFQISCCRDVAEALAAIECQPPDVIVSSIVLNQLSGQEFCERVKQRPELKDVPVMILSPAQVPDIIRRHDACGGTYYVRKSCEGEVLLQLLERVLGLSPHQVY